MTNREALKIYSDLVDISRSDIQLPVLISYTIAFNCSKLKSVLAPYFEVQKSLIDRYGENGSIERSNPNFNKAKGELDKLGDQGIEDIPFKKIKLNDLEEAGKLPANVVSSLLFMIEE